MSDTSNPRERKAFNRAAKDFSRTRPTQDQNAVTCPWHIDDLKHPKDAPVCFPYVLPDGSEVQVVSVGHLMQWCAVRLSTGRIRLWWLRRKYRRTEAAEVKADD